MQNDQAAVTRYGVRLTASWCACSAPSDQGSEPDFIFSDNGECATPRGCGMNHHHYHCTNCGAILQVG